MTDGWGKEYTAALIGCGRIGYSLGLDKKREQPASHTMALLENPRISLIAGVDKNNVNLNIWHSANKRSVCYSDCANLYARQKPDIVVVAVNEPEHLKEALNAIAAKPKLVILEKPVALNLTEALQIEESAKKNNVPILVNHERRFSKDYHLAKSYLNEIGEIQSVHASLCSSLCVYSKKQESTGAYSLLHDGTHLADIVLFFLEDEKTKSTTESIAKEVRQGGGLLSHASQVKVPDEKLVCSLLNSPVVTGIYKDENNDVRNFSAHYSTEKCPDITISISGRSKYFGFEIDILGTTGRICVGNGYLDIYKREQSKLYSGFYSLEKDKSVKYPKKTNSFSNMVQNAVDFLDGKTELKSDLQKGINALAVIEEIKSKFY